MTYLWRALIGLPPLIAAIVVAIGIFVRLYSYNHPPLKRPGMIDFIALGIIFAWLALMWMFKPAWYHPL
jgi:hypothetical protein